MYQSGPDSQNPIKKIRESSTKSGEETLTAEAVFEATFVAVASAAS